MVIYSISMSQSLNYVQMDYNIYFFNEKEGVRLYHEVWILFNLNQFDFHMKRENKDRFHKVLLNIKGN